MVVWGSFLTAMVLFIIAFFLYRQAMYRWQGTTRVLVFILTYVVIFAGGFCLFLFVFHP